MPHDPPAAHADAAKQGLGAPMKYDDELFLILLAVFVLIGLAVLLAVLY